MDNVFWMLVGVVLTLGAKWIAPVVIYVFGPRQTSITDEFRVAQILCRIGVAISTIAVSAWSMLMAMVMGCLLLIDFAYRRINHKLVVN